ncbi:Site-specific recombinase (fragment) [Xanthomonas citri pv. fuscans]
MAALLFLYRNVLRIDRHHVFDEIPSVHNLE